MTFNNGYGDHKACKSERGFAKCKSKHPEVKEILLECGQGSGSRTFTSSNAPPFQLAHITIDTTCLKKPKVVIKFSSIFNVELSDTTGTTGIVLLQYELLRTRENEEPKSLGFWMFELVDGDLFRFATIGESFNFIFCECTTCLGCCEYFVKVIPLEINEARVTVSDGRMAALAQSSSDC